MTVLLFFLTGLVCIIAGVAMIYIPAAWITAGAGLIVTAYILAKGGEAAEDEHIRGAAADK